MFYDDLEQPLSVWEEMMYKLCYLHPGCTRAVSLPMPLYNAHKMGFRVGQVYRAALSKGLDISTINQTLKEEEEEEEEVLEEESRSKGSGYPEIIIPDSLKWTHFYL